MCDPNKRFIKVSTISLVVEKTYNIKYSIIKDIHTVCYNIYTFDWNKTLVLEIIYYYYIK